jgi:hypothetical protein
MRHDGLVGRGPDDAPVRLRVIAPTVVSDAEYRLVPILIGRLCEPLAGMCAGTHVRLRLASPADRISLRLHIPGTRLAASGLCGVRPRSSATAERSPPTRSHVANVAHRGAQRVDSPAPGPTPARFGPAATTGSCHRSAAIASPTSCATSRPWSCAQ